MRFADSWKPPHPTWRTGHAGHRGPPLPTQCSRTARRGAMTRRTSPQWPSAPRPDGRDETVGLRGPEDHLSQAPIGFVSRRECPEARSRRACPDHQWVRSAPETVLLQGGPSAATPAVDPHQAAGIAALEPPCNLPISPQASFRAGKRPAIDRKKSPGTPSGPFRTPNWRRQPVVAGRDCARARARDVYPSCHWVRSAPIGAWIDFDPATTGTVRGAPTGPRGWSGNVGSARSAIWLSGLLLVNLSHGGGGGVLAEVDPTRLCLAPGGAAR